MGSFDELFPVCWRSPSSIKFMGGLFLHFAVATSKYDCVEKLLDGGADLTFSDADGKTALHLAAQKSLRMVEILMEKATPEVLNIIDVEGKTPFIVACCHGNDAIVSYFLNRGCDVNVVYGPDHDTPLLGALSCEKLSLNTIKVLLSAGANVKVKNAKNETPFLRACQRFNCCKISSIANSVTADICFLLLDKGSDVNVQSATLRFTPLHNAVIMRNELLVRRLLNCGSLINAVSSFGLCPLFYACESRLLKIAKLLIDSGSDLREVCDPRRQGKDLFRSQIHLMPDSVLSYVIRRSKECRSLQDSCRLVIRKNLPIDIEKSALLLPLPNDLIKFIQLVK